MKVLAGLPEYDISYNDTPRSNYSTMTKNYNTTVAVRWQAYSFYQGLIKLISKFVTLFIITIYLYAMHGVFYKLQTCECHIGLLAARRPTRGYILHRHGNQDLILNNKATQVQLP